MIPFFMVKPINFVLSILFVILAALDFFGIVEIGIPVYMTVLALFVMGVGFELYLENVDDKSTIRIEDLARSKGYNQLVIVKEFYLEVYPELGIGLDMAGSTYKFTIPAVMSLPKRGTYVYFEENVNDTQFMVALSSYDLTLFLAYKS